MLIIPAIDLLGGHCVRLHQGDYGRVSDYGANPSVVAQEFLVEGAELIHVVDLDGAKQGAPVNLAALESILATGAKVEFGGGVRSLDTARTLLRMGVSRVVFGTKLLHDAEFRRDAFSEFKEAAVGGVDCRDGLVAVSGWLETSAVKASDLIQALAGEGCKRVILTDIQRDGTKSGPNVPLLETIQNCSPIPIVQSGGVGSIQDILTLLNLQTPPEAVIIGRALYEGSFTVSEALQAVRNHQS